MKDGKLKELTGKEMEEMRDKKPLPIGIDDFKTIQKKIIIMLIRQK